MQLSLSKHVQSMTNGLFFKLSIHYLADLLNFYVWLKHLLLAIIALRLEGVSSFLKNTGIIFLFLSEKNCNIFYIRKVPCGNLKELKILFREAFKKVMGNIFHFQKNWCCLPFSKHVEFVFHFPKNGDCLSFLNLFVGRLHFSKKCEVVFHFQKYWGLLQCFV